MLAILQAYIHTYLSRFSLQAFLQQQQQLLAARGQSAAGGAGDADWEGGSIAASAVTKKTKFKPPKSIAGIGMGVGYGDSVSYAMSSTSNTIKAALAAKKVAVGAAAKDELAVNAVTAAGDSQAHCTVAAAPAPQTLTAAAAATLPPGMPPAASSSTAKVGNAKSLVDGGCAKSVIGGYAPSMIGGGSTAWGWDGTAEGGGSLNSGPEELGVHGVLLLCRELGLIDNITEHSDIIQCFELMLHRKRGRLGPAGGKPASSNPGSAAAAGTSGINLSSSSEQQAQQVLQQATQRQAVTDSTATANSSNVSNGSDGSQAAGCTAAQREDGLIMVVHVVRSGLPAAAGAAAYDGTGCGSRAGQAAACDAPGSSIVGRVLSVESLGAQEVLELLILVNTERHTDSVNYINVHVHITLLS